MKIQFSLKQIALVILLSFVAVSCSDDAVSSNDDAPELPEFQNAEPDLSYFQNNPPQNNDSNYSDAYYYGIGLGSFGFITQSYLAFFSQATTNDADFRNGKWVWEYSYSFEGQSVSIELISEEIGDFVEWDMLWSADDGQGNSYTDYRVVEGRIKKDGSSGTWVFNNLNPDSGDEVLELETNWSSTGDNNLQTQVDFYENGIITSSYNYSQDENEFLVSLSETDSQDDITVFWDDIALTGYYQEGSSTSTRFCWDSSYQDVSCSAVGY